MADRLNKRQKDFVHQLARFLVEDQAHQSIGLQMQKPEALKWAALRNETPLRGYPTVAEAEKDLTEFLWPTK